MSKPDLARIKHLISEISDAIDAARASDAEVVLALTMALAAHALSTGLPVKDAVAALNQTYAEMKQRGQS